MVLVVPPCATVMVAVLEATRFELAKESASWRLVVSNAILTQAESDLTVMFAKFSDAELEVIGTFNGT